MKALILSILIISVPLASQATTWNGTSTRIGNTTYHNYHSNDGVTVLPATQHHYHHDNGAAAAGIVVLGVFAGALLLKGVSSCINACRKPKTIYQQNNYYWNCQTQQYEYYQP